MTNTIIKKIIILKKDGVVKGNIKLNLFNFNLNIDIDCKIDGYLGININNQVFFLNENKKSMKAIIKENQISAYAIIINNAKEIVALGSNDGTKIDFSLQEKIIENFKLDNSTKTESSYASSIQHSSSINSSVNIFPTSSNSSTFSSKDIVLNDSIASLEQQNSTKNSNRISHTVEQNPVINIQNAKQNPVSTIQNAKQNPVSTIQNIEISDIINLNDNVQSSEIQNINFETFDYLQHNNMSDYPSQSSINVINQKSEISANATLVNAFSEGSLYNNKTEIDSVQNNILNFELIKPTTKTVRKYTIKNPFYKAVEKQLTNLFKTEKRCDKLEKVIPFSKWVELPFDENNNYVVGLIYEENVPQFICYGVPSENELENLSTMSQYFRLPNENDGYYMMYQDAISGNTITEII